MAALSCIPTPIASPTWRGWGMLGAGLALTCLAGNSGCDFGNAAPSKPLLIAISGDTAGWIVPCGCTTNQSGGLLRRGTYLDQLRQQGDLVYLDAGGALHGTSPYDIAKFEAILQGEKKMGISLHNIGAAEAALGEAELRRIEQTLDDEPLFLSANVHNHSGQPLGIPAKVLEIGQRRVLVIGVLSPSFATDQLEVSDPKQAILNELQRSQESGGHDVSIVLAYLPEEELRELASQLPEVDAIVGGPTGQAMAPEQNGPLLLASATNKGKFLIRLTLPVGKKQRMTGEVVEMTEDFAESPGQQANLDDFYQELAARDFMSSETSFETAPAGESHRIAGTKSCRQCHEADCQVWEHSAHAHAWQTLLKTGSQVDSYCQQCHVTGFGLPGGFVSAKRSLDRVNVGCESCHGPSQRHAEQPQQRTYHFQNAASTCVRCHDPENSPLFDYDTYWPRIEHGLKGTS
ncbi:hypothetical protein DTL42_02740 [Bremerella cremea]|uniref:Cytochrome c-552/4 domain-containing protein n=1 Tax=Bremerella cremea TaxID=1031537 RepID=A0A368KUV1_9BACT|nr:multiheme c-type cytochrome [Bremerella cremea]RCS54086.1 hypothetical protein DTL42_02740 [Bremerella cremea]